MVVADFAGDLPFAVFVLPQTDVFAFAGWVVGFWMQKAVRAQLHRAVTLHVICLKRSRNEFASNIASTNIFLDAFGQLGGAQRDSTLIVVELDVFREKTTKCAQVAAIVSVEERQAQRHDHFVQVRLILNAFE